MPIDMGAIESYCGQYDLVVPRWIFNECILVLDGLFLDEAYKKK